MDETTGYDTMPVGDASYSDPISSIFGLFGFIIILGLVIILIAMIMLGNGIGWIAKTVTGQNKEKFEGPQPCPEHDYRCAHFPAI